MLGDGRVVPCARNDTPGCWQHQGQASKPVPPVPRRSASSCTFAKVLTMLCSALPESRTQTPARPKPVRISRAGVQTLLLIQRFVRLNARKVPSAPTSCLPSPGSDICGSCIRANNPAVQLERSFFRKTPRLC